MPCWLRLSVCFSIALLGCKEDNPRYCEGHPDDTVNCPPPDSGLCTEDPQCPGQVCDTASGACVQCTPAKASACTGTTPVCGSDDTCGPCTMHAQCTGSNVCLPSGACGDASMVAYVEAGKTGDCEQATPCGTLTAGVAKNRPYVKVTGAVNDATTTVISRAVTILAAPSASVNVTADDVPVISVSGSSADVAIYDLEITGATMTSGVGIDLPTGGAPKLSLTRVSVDSNQGAGISSSGGTLTVNQSTVSSNQGGGISSSGGTLTVSQSTVSSNQGGGISVSGSGATFDITNNFIYRNGNSTTATVGGASLVPLGASVFAFNTVVDNQIQNSGALSGGVFCDASGFTAPNNIIARNFVNNDPNKVNSNTSGLCTYPTSTIAAAVTGLAFVSPDNAPHNYRIGSGSTALDGATTSSSVAVDHDGDARPQGAAKDRGADEYKP